MAPPRAGYSRVRQDDPVTTGEASARRIAPPVRRDARVMPLELFFDLVFVLALTQCTALMADEPTWQGLAKGLLVLGVLWWAWVGYAWLTSVVDPEEWLVRSTMFAAMAALLIVALAVPEAFGDLALLFACAYAFVRIAHIALFVIIGRDDPAFLRSTIGLAVGTAIGFSLLVAASFADGWAQGLLWAIALALDVGEPYVFGSEGWRLEPGHFVERHGLFVIIALGESIVAIGIGAEHAHRRRRRASRPSSASRSPPRCGGSTSTWSRSWPSGDSTTPPPAGSATSWPATPSRTSTSRWSRASSCWRSG